MTECNAIIEANNEIDELKRENKELNKLCVRYGFEVGRLGEENEELKQFQDTVFVLINEMIGTANHYRTPIKSLDYGNDLGYWNGVYQKLKELREILEKRKR